MPPLVLADSDDEGEELLDPEQTIDDGHPGAVAEPGAATINASTTSSEELQERIRRAEADLMAPTASMGGMSAQSPMPPSSSSKRRHTAAFHAEPSISPEKQVKRNKTSQKTYSKQRSSAPRIQDEEAFSKFRNDDTDERAPSSRSARFTEHSGAASSSHDLPAGSLRADFLDHQPHVMFRETGSTAVDNESSQQRMIEQARNSMRGASTSVSRLIESDEAKSSSFPWSASVHTQSTKKAVVEGDGVAGSGDLHDDEADHDPPGVEPAVTFANNDDGLQPIADGAIDQAASEYCQENPELKGLEAEQPGSSTQLPRLDFITAPKSSPRVEITLPTARAGTETDGAAEQTQRAGRGRKRKTKADESEKLSSESQAVGLPKEMYVPRPSKRRATHVAGEVIDYSIKPEKAAKAKRTKTTTASTSINEEAKTPAEFRGEGMNEGSPENKAKQDCISPSKPASEASAIPGDTTMQSTTADAKANISDSETPQGSGREPSKVEADEDEVFVKPALPKTSKKIKRSHTTIFEDHVDLTASQRRPSLSQQQAARKSALASAEKQSTDSRATQRRRKVIEDDDEDDEDERDSDRDELSHEPKSSKAQQTGSRSVEPEKQPTKKRRGRPPSKKTPAESIGTVGAGLLSEEENVAPFPEDVEPKKRGRGRPAKKPTEAVHPVPDGATQQPKLPSDDSAEPKMFAHVSSQLGNGTTCSAQEPTPSPEKKLPPTKLSTPPPKSSPASHSPIKGSSTVPLRVGLSKRQRIPSLLRVMRPPTKR